LAASQMLEVTMGDRGAAPRDGREASERMTQKPTSPFVRAIPVSKEEPWMN